jgi:hypothetical protein
VPVDTANVPYRDLGVPKTMHASRAGAPAITASGATGTVNLFRPAVDLLIVCTAPGPLLTWHYLWYRNGKVGGGNASAATARLGSYSISIAPGDAIVGDTWEWRNWMEATF